MPEIILACGRFTLVDDIDFGPLSQLKWCRQGGRDGKYYVGGYRRLMHRMIMGATPGQFVDHINGDTFDNRRCNLRFCDHRQNGHNKRRTTNRLGVKGVCLHKKTGKYAAYIRVNGKTKHLGLFVTCREAAMKYDAAAVAHFGRYAATNQILSLI